MSSPISKPTLALAAFALCTLTPLVLLTVGVFQGGYWLWGALCYTLALAGVIDQFIPLVLGDAEEGREFPGSDLLLMIIALGALLALPTAVWAIAGHSGRSSGEKILIFIALGHWLGQVGHPAAHELIHRPTRVMFWLGRMVYSALLFGQHVSAHRLVHHRYVATPLDPNSARKGEGFYHFFWRAWRGSFWRGMEAESKLRKGKTLHPYGIYFMIYAFSLCIAFVIGGFGGLLVWLALALQAQIQILVSDYVQHYGLRRASLPNGKFEPVGPQHSWNTSHWFSSAMMLNAPRHSDHHVNPMRPYPKLRLPQKDVAPRLPWPLPLACAMAFIPSLWRRKMKRHLKKWNPS